MFEPIQEAATAALAISDESARILSQLGKSFASKKSWFGDAALPETERSVISCTPIPGGYSVRVDDCIGVIATPEFQLTISPKIDMAHFLHLMTEALGFPRYGKEAVSLARSSGILELLFTWFLNAAERVMRRGLLSDYIDRNDEVRMPRGSINVVSTTQRYYRGNLAFDCDFEEFDVDISVNRLLKAACLALSRSPCAHKTLRDRGRRMGLRFDSVGALRSSDIDVRLDRRLLSYSIAVPLAKAILRAEVRSLDAGSVSGWAYLIPTPALIEMAIRSILRKHLPEATVVKRGLTLSNNVMTVNPDLVFESRKYVGDVKYKRYTEGWSRADLYQSVAFATAFGSTRSCVISFKHSSDRDLPEARFGNTRVSSLAWVEGDVEPQQAEIDFILRVREWLQSAQIEPIDNG